jgi:hypothetical protein
VAGRSYCLNEYPSYIVALHTCNSFMLYSIWENPFFSRWHLLIVQL